MHKNDIIRHLTRKVVDKKLAKLAVDSVFEIIQHGLKRDGKVAIVGFGSFQLKTARPVTRHNPKTMEKVKIPAKKKIRFKASGKYLRKLNLPK